MISSPPSRIPFTAAKYAELQAELRRLQQYKQEVMGRLQEARAQGDLSENGAYTAAKFELGTTNRRLREVRHQLSIGFVADVPTPGTQPTTAEFGCHITLTTLAQPAVTSTYQLVSEYESDPLQKRVSLTSPIGQALFGKKVGDRVVVSTPRGDSTYTITAITA